MLEDLRGLRASLNVAIELLERLEPVVTAWRGAAVQDDVASANGAEKPNGAQSGLGSPPAADAVSPLRGDTGETPIAHDAPAGAQRTAVSEAHPRCEQCGEAFTVTNRGGPRKRYCSTSCRNIVRGRRQRAKAAAKPHGEPGDAAGTGEAGHREPERPFRTPALRGEDPEKARHLAPPPLPWEQPAGTPP